MNPSNLFVITGGPGAGKTTILEELRNLGFPCVSEVARQIILQQMRDGGKALPWGDRELYTRLMLERSIESYQEHAPASGPTFFDRGIPDTLGYAHLIGLKDDDFIRDACTQHRYATHVFLAPPWKEIYETDGERKQDFAEAERTCDVLRQVYAECGYQLVELPRSAPRERAAFILMHLMGVPR